MDKENEELDCPIILGKLEGKCYHENAKAWWEGRVWKMKCWECGFEQTIDFSDVLKNKEG